VGSRDEARDGGEAFDASIEDRLSPVPTRKTDIHGRQHDAPTRQVAAGTDGITAGRRFMSEAMAE
jgi:hypothetical protein